MLSLCMHHEVLCFGLQFLGLGPRMIVSFVWGLQFLGLRDGLVQRTCFLDVYLCVMYVLVIVESSSTASMKLLQHMLMQQIVIRSHSLKVSVPQICRT
jgi:hypothetical protein